MKTTIGPAPGLQGTNNNDTCVDPALDLLFLAYDSLSHTVPSCKIQPENLHSLSSITTNITEINY
jgi:hypothetical protein